MDFVYLLGWVVTAVVITLVYARRLRGHSVIPGVLIGLVAGLLWPVALWIAIGLGWYWSCRPDPRMAATASAKLAEARAFEQHAIHEGMHNSAAYWTAEVQRLSAQEGPDRAAGKDTTPPAMIAVLSFAGMVITFVLIGLAVGPPPESNTAAAQSPTTQSAPASPTTHAAAATTTQPPKPPQPAAPPPPVADGTVVDVIDGDTVDVALTGGGTERVRVLGIDTPDVFGGERCGGRAASDFAEGTLAGKPVQLDADPRQDDRDAYDRALRYVVLLDGGNYSILAAEAGAARSYVYETPVMLHPEIVAAERRAQAADAGLWGPPCYGVTEELALEPGPAPVADPAEDESGGGAAYYANCSAARAAGAAPLYTGDPGYSSKLDRDGDGVACES